MQNCSYKFADVEPWHFVIVFIVDGSYGVFNKRDFITPVVSGNGGEKTAKFSIKPSNKNMVDITGSS
jgi:hypothetical protein